MWSSHNSRNGQSDLFMNFITAFVNLTSLPVPVWCWTRLPAVDRLTHSGRSSCIFTLLSIVTLSNVGIFGLLMCVGVLSTVCLFVCFVCGLNALYGQMNCPELDSTQSRAHLAFDKP